MEVKIIKEGKVMFEGDPADAREKVEDMFLEELGFTPALQETSIEELEEGEPYQIYIHTDTYDDLGDSQLEVLDELNITEIGEETTKVICEMFNVKFESKK